MTSAPNAGFDLIWNRLPHLENRHSSVWWFFLLFPEQAEGYGPKQMMFNFIAKRGQKIGINGDWHPGFAAGGGTRSDDGRTETLPGSVVGWIYDGQKMHEGIVHTAATLTHSQDGYVSAWTEGADGQPQYGGEMRASGSRPAGIQAQFCGAKGEAAFEVWGDPASAVTMPDDSLLIDTRLGGAHVVAWRQLYFKGTFASPSGREELAGVGYFQRICLNINPFPWKWIWLTFADGSVFSTFIPYIGLHYLRRGDRFFPQFIERATLPITQKGYFSWGGNHAINEFDRISVVPDVTSGGLPTFAVHARAGNGDFLRFQARPFSHAQFLLDEKGLGGVWPTRYNYNEFLFRTEGVEGKVAGRSINQSSVGQGFGNCEYTWGLGA